MYKNCIKKGVLSVPSVDVFQGGCAKDCIPHECFNLTRILHPALKMDLE